MSAAMYYAMIAHESHDANGTSIWTAEYPALPGCHATGRTAAEAIERLEAAREEWVRVALDVGMEVPEPTCEDLSITYQYARRKDARGTTTAADGPLHSFEPAAA